MMVMTLCRQTVKEPPTKNEQMLPYFLPFFPPHFCSIFHFEEKRLSTCEISQKPKGVGAGRGVGHEKYPESGRVAFS